MDVLRIGGSFVRLRLATPPPYDDVNLYLHSTEDGRLILIDAGPAVEDCLRQIRAALLELGYSAERLDAVLVTHYHVDHSGLAGALQRLSGCEVFVHPNDLEALSDPAKRFLERMREIVGEVSSETVRSKIYEFLELNAKRLSSHFTPVNPKPLPQGGSIYGLRFLEAPGHTAGSVVYLSDDGKNGFCGDTALDTLTLTIEHFEQYAQTLRHLLAAKLPTLWPGHGGVLEPAQRWLEALEQKYMGRLRSVVEIIGKPRTLYEVAKSLYGELDWGSAHRLNGNPVLALLQAKSYLTYLVENGFAERRAVGGETIYVRSGGFPASSKLF